MLRYCNAKNRCLEVEDRFKAHFPEKKELIADHKMMFRIKDWMRYGQKLTRLEKQFTGQLGEELQKFKQEQEMLIGEEARKQKILSLIAVSATTVAVAALAIAIAYYTPSQS